MALIDCVECEHRISDQAFSCPQCGFPMKQQAPLLKLNHIQKTDVKIYKDIFKASFWWSSEGRITRSQFLIGFILLMMILGASVFVIDYISEIFSEKCYRSYYYWECVAKVVKVNLFFKIPLLLCFAYIFIAICVKRFHDFGKTGAYFLGLFLPIIGFYFLWILLFTQSDENENIFGENPKA